MSKLISNKGYIGLGVQTAKGSAAAASDIFVKYLEDTFATEMDTTPLREGGDGEVINTVIKNMHREKFGFSVLARPEVVAYLYAWFLGDDTVTGSADPYTHTIIRAADSRKWLTIRKKLDTSVVQKITDCKIDEITVEGEAGKEIKLTVAGSGLTSAIETTEETPTYEASAPFVFYHSNGAFKIEGSVNTDIKKFSVKLAIDSGGGLQTDDVVLNELPDLKIDGDISLDLNAADTAFWKKANYNNQTTIQDGLYSGAFEFDCKYTENVADDREFKLNIGKFIWKPINLPLKGEPEVQTQTIAGILTKPSSGEPETVTVKNDIATDLA